MTSLVTVNAAVSDFVASAWLVAETCTVAGDGRSAGAVYTPSAAMVPTVALPLGVPFTLQLTLVSVAFVTFAVNAIVFPSSTDPLFGATVTTMEGGGGGGGNTELEPPVAQPCVHAPAVKRAAITIRVVPNFFAPSSGRGRIPFAKQAKGQRKMECTLIGNARRGLQHSLRNQLQIRTLSHFGASHRFDGELLVSAYFFDLCPDLERAPPA